MLNRSFRLLKLGNHASWCARKVSRSQAVTFSSQMNPSSEQSLDSHAQAAAEPVSSSKGGFAKAMAKIEGLESFPKTIRFSSLVQMGDPQGKIVEGTIVHAVDDDLYIDFGGKFNCVCPRPQKNGSAYTLGKRVRVMIHDLELSTRFLGAKTDLTILEADCSLLGLAKSVKTGNLVF